MQNKQANIQTAVLVILTILVAVYLWKLFSMDKRMKEEASIGTGQVIVEDQRIPTEEKNEEPKLVQDTPKVTFLKSFINKYETFVTPLLPEIRECQNAGTEVIAVTYDGEHIADGGWTIYDANTQEVVENCGGFTAEPMPENSFCRTGLASCPVIYKSATGVDIDVYNLN